MKDPSLKHCN